MRAQTIPPMYGFKYVMSTNLKHDPMLEQIVQPYSEPRRRTFCIMLRSKNRALVFFTKKSSKERFHRLGWEDVTRDFRDEWVKEEDGWAHTPFTAKPVTGPDSRTSIILSDEDLANEDSKTAAYDNLSVKNLQKVLKSGVLDEHIDGLLSYERSKGEDIRTGAISALASRKSVLNRKSKK